MTHVKQIEISATRAPIQPKFPTGTRVVVRIDKGHYLGTITKNIMQDSEHCIKFDNGEVDFVKFRSSRLLGEGVQRVRRDPIEHTELHKYLIDGYEAAVDKTIPFKVNRLVKPGTTMQNYQMVVQALDDMARDSNLASKIPARLSTLIAYLKAKRNNPTFKGNSTVDAKSASALLKEACGIVHLFSRKNPEIVTITHRRIFQVLADKQITKDFVATMRKVIQAHVEKVDSGGKVGTDEANPAVEEASKLLAAIARHQGLEFKDNAVVIASSKLHGRFAVRCSTTEYVANCLSNKAALPLSIGAKKLEALVVEAQGAALLAQSQERALLALLARSDIEYQMPEKPEGCVYVHASAIAQLHDVIDFAAPKVVAMGEQRTVATGVSKSDVNLRVVLTTQGNAAQLALAPI